MKILFIDLNTRLKSITDLDSHARGGMITSLFKVSDALSQMHSVTVLSDIKRGGVTAKGTSWVNAEMFDYRQLFDVLVSNRGAGEGWPGIIAKKRVLWTHDLPHSGFAVHPKVLRQYSRVVFMSKYAERVWRTVFKEIGKSTLIPNGVDKKLFQPRAKGNGFLIYASAPNRGLKRLPLIFEAIKSRVSGAVFMRAYSNMGKLHPGEVLDAEKDGYSLDYKNAMDAGIEMYDPIPQEKLAVELGQAGLMILPTDYPEICSNIILQSLACGTPVITTGNLGSAGEWIKHRKNGMLTKYHPVDYMVHTIEIVRNAIEVLNNRNLHEKMIRNAAKTKILTWEQVGQKWHKMIGGL